VAAAASSASGLGLLSTPLSMDLSPKVRSAAAVRFFALLQDMLPDRLEAKLKSKAKKTKAKADGEDASDASGDEEEEDDEADEKSSAKTKAKAGSAAASAGGSGVAADDGLFVYQVHAYWNELESKGFELLQELSAEGSAARADALRLVDGIRKELARPNVDAAAAAKQRAFASFILHLALFQLQADASITPLLGVRCVVCFCLLRCLCDWCVRAAWRVWW
jgi:hypothetical protein